MNGEGKEKSQIKTAAKIHTTYLLIPETCYHNTYNEISLGLWYKFLFLSLLSLTIDIGFLNMNTQKRNGLRVFCCFFFHFLNKCSLPEVKNTFTGQSTSQTSQSIHFLLNFLYKYIALKWNIYTAAQWEKSQAI